MIGREVMRSEGVRSEGLRSEGVRDEGFTSEGLGSESFTSEALANFITSLSHYIIIKSLYQYIIDLAISCHKES